MSEDMMEGKAVFEAVMGWPATKNPGSLREKRERRIFRRLLDMGSAYATIQARGSAAPTARQIHVFLGCKYDLCAIEVYLCQEQWRGYLAAMQREPSLFLRGLEYLEATESRASVHAADIAQEIEDMQRVYRGDPRGRGGMQ